LLLIQASRVAKNLFQVKNSWVIVEALSNILIKYEEMGRKRNQTGKRNINLDDENDYKAFMKYARKVLRESRQFVNAFAAVNGDEAKTQQYLFKKYGEEKGNYLFNAYKDEFKEK
jgi:cytochrome oxidase Cu insertion factor (SCO1/SenC/PrrC family)